MVNLIDIYKNDLSKKNFFYDKAQETVLLELNELFNRLKLKNVQRDNVFFSDIINFFKKDNNFGLYIWGDVGRGKTYLVDLFFLHLPFEKKIRLHFHHFMKLVHDKLKFYSGEKDPLKLIAKWFCKEYLIVCLDEFFVKDIGDAMNLSRLFNYLFEFEVFFVITSNIMPSKLYQGGLQRQKFLPTIYLFEKFLKITNINSDIDYRFLHFESEQIFIYSLSFTAFKRIKRLFFKLCRSNPKRKIFLDISGRKIFAYYVFENIVWFGFDFICGFGRSHLDYVEIATLFKVVFLSGVKSLALQNDDNARRFISLVDEFYDRKINVIMSFDCDINFLYSGELLKFDFKRTISRLTEMSTKAYLRDFNKNGF